MKTTVFNKDKSARNLFGTNSKASDWGHPKSGPPEVSLFVKIRNKFGLTRPTTTLTKEAWPNPPKGPPNNELPIEIDRHNADLNEIREDLKTAKPWSSHKTHLMTMLAITASSENLPLRTRATAASILTDAQSDPIEITL
tara:strand:- start:3016 stop:3435 length:420 start_codon:yes stop_codon:yes gene_type:complete